MAEADRKPLSREEILNAEKPLRQVQLPSGIIVTIKYLAYFLVLKLLEAIESEENKENIFAERVIRLLLRENEQQELNSFPREDQIRLIEIAAVEWGCMDEFNKLSDSLAVEDRFYQAGKERNNKFSLEMRERMKVFSSSISRANFAWFDDYQRNLKNITDQLTIPVADQMSEVVRQLNRDTFDQFSKIGQYTVQISGITDLMSSLSSAITIPFEESLIAAMRETMSHYQNLMNDIVSIDNFTVLPEVERYYPSLEMRNLSVAANLTLARDEVVLLDEVISPAEEDLIIWLGGLDNAFPNILRGAEQAITSQNPDKCRHFASSHRELCTHILHTLAPDDEVVEWTVDPNHFYEGRPTRRARLLFIARYSYNGPFVEFFISSFLSQMKLLNADEHRRRQEYGEKELRVLHESFLSTLDMLMMIVRVH